MKEISNINEIQKIEKDLLNAFILFCQENNLKYYLAYGSALGTIRHHGFIPWDDDIDVCMPRQDYDKLLDLIKAENKISKSCVFKIPGDKNYSYSFIKLINPNTFLVESGLLEKYSIGVWIDIFPIDHVSENDKDRKKYIKQINLLNKIIQYNSLISVKSRPTNNIIKNYIKQIVIMLSKLLVKCVSLERFTMIVDNLARNYDLMNQSSNLYSEIVWYHQEKDVYNKDIIFPLRKGQFEKIECSLPNDVNQYLILFYGYDYMKLPPIEKRKTHKLNVYWIGEKACQN